jgi:microcystin-dependent protein
MSSPYVGEIRIFAGNFAPVGWLFCDGSLIPISENETLFNLIGTTYGGDGQNTFALPDLRGRVPIHQGTGFTLAQLAGTETVTLTTQQIPAHSHTPNAVVEAGDQASPSATVWAQSAADPYSAITPSVAMAAAAVASAGGSQPHENMIPFLAVNFIISLYGVFPSPN